MLRKKRSTQSRILTHGKNEWISIFFTDHELRLFINLCTSLETHEHYESIDTKYRKKKLKLPELYKKLYFSTIY